MEYVSADYQTVLDNLSETLRAERREQFLAQLAMTDSAIPTPRQEMSAPQLMAEIV